MKKYIAFAAFILASPVMALPIVYTNQTDFINAIGGPYALEDFESRATGAYGTATTIGNLTFDSGPTSDISILDATHAFGAHNTTAGGTNYLFADGASQFHDDMHMSTVGSQNLIAWGAYFTDLDFGTINFLVDGVTLHSPTPGGNGNTMFVGFVAGVGESFQTVTLSVNDESYGIDDVITATAPIPEPATVSLLSLGVLGLVARRRARTS